MARLRNWVTLGIRIVALALAALGVIGLAGILVGLGVMGAPMAGPARMAWIVPLVYVALAAVLYALSRPLAHLLTRDLEDEGSEPRPGG